MKTPNKILIIIQRSNGDVFLSSSLIKNIYEHYHSPQIDLLVNEDTLPIARLIPYIKNIHKFSYSKKKNNRWGQEIKLIKKIFKKYDLSINLTASDRSVMYAFLAGKKTISAIEKNLNKSWWKKYLLSNYYFFDTSNHILFNNLKALNILKIKYELIHYPFDVSIEATKNVKKMLRDNKINKFIIFHPSTQYEYKVYPQNRRDSLIKYLSEIGITVIITGGNTLIDLKIKQQISILPNIHDFIGKTSLEEFVALSDLSLGYVGMDTLNMHIAASQNKRIFAIFGPTNLRMWSPWENNLKSCATEDMPIQTYGNVTIFQANFPCVACGKAGCDDNHGTSICLDNIRPKTVFNEVRNWFFKLKTGFEIEISDDNI
ncbi:glycosyltransferase family 9 protein [Candidatus Pseudothioglobus singularis]|nr:glycosyltransferase family 9 protein [Candidatus Pseudothioglobus singularis]